MLVVMVASYTCFLWFINGTAARYLRVRAEMELAHQIHQVLVPAIAETHRRVRVLGLLGAQRRGRRRSRGRGDAATTTLVRLRRRRLRPRRVVRRRHGDVQERHPHAAVAAAAPISSLLDDLNTVLFPLKSGACTSPLACVPRRRAAGALEFAVAGHLPILRVRAPAARRRNHDAADSDRHVRGLPVHVRRRSTAIAATCSR